MVASKPFPVFNLGRQDLPHVVLIGAFSAAAALALRAGEGGSPGPDKSAWRGLTIILCTLSAIVMSGLALAKVIAPFFHESLGGGLFQGYTQLEEGSGRADAPVVETRSVRPQQAAAPSTEKREIEQPSSRPVSEAVRSSRASYRASYSPREEEDIECGLLLEASAVDFEYNGVRHQKGALRVIKVERDGVCERQGACTVGDVLVAVDGKQVAGMHPNKVKALMRGKAGTSIILGLYTDQSRELINRHVVLAPSPSAIMFTPRDSLASRRSGGQ